MAKGDFCNKVKKLPTFIKALWHNPPQGRYLTLKEIIAFGGSSLGISFIVNMLVSVITASQISEIYQIGVLHGPIIVLSASFLGLILQPLYGKLLQNTNTKWGRYKPYIIGLAPIISALGIAATWLPQGLNEQSMAIYAYCTCIPSLILWNIWFNTFNMMPAVITPNQQERTDVWSPIGLVIGFAPTVINFIKGFVRSYFLRQGNEHLAYRYMGLISVILGLSLVFMIVKVKERIIVTEENNERVGLFEGLKMVIKNKPLMILTLAMIVGCMREVIGMDMEILGRLRYATTLDKGSEIYSSLTLVVGFAATPNMILLPLFVRKFNNKTILMFWTGLNVLGYSVLAIIGIQNIPQGSASAILITLLRFIALFNALGSLHPLMLSEIYDYQQLLTGKRLEGFIQTFAYSLVGVITNLSILAMGFIKKKMGFEPKNYFNTLRVSDELMDIATSYFNIAIIISAISAALMFIVLIFYNLNKQEHSRIIEELQQISDRQASQMVKERVEIENSINKNT